MPDDGELPTLNLPVLGIGHIARNILRRCVYSVGKLHLKDATKYPWQTLIEWSRNKLGSVKFVARNVNSTLITIILLAGSGPCYAFNAM